MVPQFARQAGFDEAQWQLALCVWGAQRIQVGRQQVLVRQGDAVRNFYVVEVGRLHLVEEDYWGNRSLLGEVEAGSMFGAAHVFAGCDAYPIRVEAAEDSVVVAVSKEQYAASAKTHPALYQQAMQGFLEAIAKRSVRLIHTIEQVKQRTIRHKVLAYLSYQARVQQSTTVRVTLTRQQMADYLAVDRAALCRELSKLQDEGLLCYKKQEFTLFLAQPY